MDTPAPARLAVVGHPVAHSRSPQIHARFAASCGHAVDYGRIEIARSEHTRGRDARSHRRKH